jgi:putative peptide zinc metalloprotease protein
MSPGPPRPTVGSAAPLFGLRSVQGATVELAAYRGQLNVVIWFSRGFTCPFCRSYMDGIANGYDDLRASGVEVIQVAPNLLESARTYFRNSATPFPFVCDPDKRLYAVYGLGDRGALEATRTALVSFSHAFTHGDTGPQLRGAWLDVMNRNFLRRLHHHAMTAVEQGIFLIDRQGLIRHLTVVGPIDVVPTAQKLAALINAHCADEIRAT